MLTCRENVESNEAEWCILTLLRPMFGDFKEDPLLQL